MNSTKQAPFLEATFYRSQRFITVCPYPEPDKSSPHPHTTPLRPTLILFCHLRLSQCFSTAGPRSATEPWHQLYRAASGSPGICHYSFLSIFREELYSKYSEENNIRELKIRECVESSDPECVITSV